VIHELVLQELADLCLVSATTKLPQQGRKHAVVLVQHLAGDADRIPLIE
jgi:hypothetical protein